MQQIGTWPSGVLVIATEGDARKLTAMVCATKDAPRRGKLAKSIRRTGVCSDSLACVAVRKLGALDVHIDVILNADADGSVQIEL